MANKTAELFLREERRLSNEFVTRATRCAGHIYSSCTETLPEDCPLRSDVALEEPTKCPTLTGTRIMLGCVRQVIEQELQD